MGTCRCSRGGRAPPWQRASCIPAEALCLSLPGSVTRIPSEHHPVIWVPHGGLKNVTPCGSSLRSSPQPDRPPARRPALGAPHEKRPQPGQVSPGSPVPGVGAGRFPRAPRSADPGHPLLRGPAPALQPPLRLFCPLRLTSARERRRVSLDPLDDQPLAMPPLCPSASSLSLTLQGCRTQLTSPPASPLPPHSDAPWLVAFLQLCRS